MPRVEIFTDGACSGNPGPGGWGAILREGEHEKELSGGEDETTNNRMELMAAISALEELEFPSQVDLHTDSTYVKDGSRHRIGSQVAMTAGHLTMRKLIALFLLILDLVDPIAFCRCSLVHAKSKLCAYTRTEGQRNWLACCRCRRTGYLYLLLRRGKSASTLFHGSVLLSVLVCQLQPDMANT